MYRDENGWIREYEKAEAFWIHDENPRRPHALLASGNHSSGFFNSELVMQDPQLLNEAASDLVEKLGKKMKLDMGMIERVVGPAMGAVTLAHDIARKLGEWRGRPCLRAYTEKIVVNGSKSMIFRKTSIRPGERVLLVEDVLTTGESVHLSEKAVSTANGVVLPYMLVLVNRSGLQEINGKMIVPLIYAPMSVWKEEDCTYCKKGSEAIRPKEIKNWARLTASY